MKAKNLILTIALTCLFTPPMAAQTIQHSGQYKVNQKIYIVKKMSNGKSLLVNGESSLISRIQKDHSILSQFEGGKFSGKVTINNAFIEVFGINRLKKMVSEPNKVDIVVILYLVNYKGKGKVTAVQFLIPRPRKTGVTLKEIDRLTAYMKKNIIIDLPPGTQQGKIIPFTQSVSFSNLIN